MLYVRPGTDALPPLMWRRVGGSSVASEPGPAPPRLPWYLARPGPSVDDKFAREVQESRLVLACFEEDRSENNIVCQCLSYMYAQGS